VVDDDAAFGTPGLGTELGAEVVDVDLAIVEVGCLG
jgi:hypothetical protein